MRAHKCYDIIPYSSKLIVFDTSLLVSDMLLFYTLLYYFILYDIYRAGKLGLPVSSAHPIAQKSRLVLPMRMKSGVW